MPDLCSFCHQQPALLVDPHDASPLCGDCAPHEVLVAEVTKLRQERDACQRETYAIRLRATDAHAAVYRAMKAPPEEALAALQDEGYVHRAVHGIFCGPEGTSAYPVDEAIQLHIQALGQRALRAEDERDRVQAHLGVLRSCAPRCTWSYCDKPATRTFAPQKRARVLGDYQGPLPDHVVLAPLMPLRCDEHSGRGQGWDNEHDWCDLPQAATLRAKP